MSIRAGKFAIFLQKNKFYLRKGTLEDCGKGIDAAIRSINDKGRSDSLHQLFVLSDKLQLTS